jgi:protein CLEC16A
MSWLFNVFGGRGNGNVGTSNQYSMERLQGLYARLQQFPELNEGNREAVVEILRQITEAVIWGERHDPNFFDFFCEKNVLADFVKVLGIPRTPKTVKVQLLQTMNMLVQNVRRDTSLYYLFSNNYMNQLIATQLDWTDEEILAYYITFLKSLALLLNAQTVKFFFQ